MTKSQREMQYTAVEQLELSGLRDVRQNVVDEIKQRIEQDGYDPARPMRVLQNGDGYVVADGNHRLQALRELNEDNSAVVPKKVPTVVEKDADIVAVSVEANENESTFAEQDLFDYLDYIDRLRDDHTQAEIAERLGWNRDKVAKRSRLLNEIVPKVLEYARKHQSGRGTKDVPFGTFTEGWFRSSGIYDLTASWAKMDEDEPKHAQMRFMEWFCNDKKCDASSGQIDSKIDSLKDIQNQLQYVENNLKESVDDDKRQSLLAEVKNNEYTTPQLEDAVENLNRQTKNQYHYGADALDELAKIDDNSIDVVVTDPPWGVEFESRRGTDNPDYDTDKEQTLAYLDEVFEELKRVVKANGHLYIFFPIAHYCEFQELAGQYFDVAEMPLMWVKNNHAPAGDETGFEDRYAPQYEPIYICRMEKGDQRKLTKKVSPNVLQYDRPGGDRWHDSQKPIPLLEDIITNVTGKHEKVLDPFAGSGSTLLAAAKNGRHYIGVEKNEDYEGEFVKHLREVENE